jgi:uncharacterized protein YjeT (DUF2065 family)
MLHFMKSLLVERFVATLLLVTAASHIVQPGMWCDWFVKLARARVAAPVIVLYTLPTGLAVVFLHNDWTPHINTIVTVFGWGQAIKGTLYALVPSVAQKMCEAQEGREANMRIAGAIFMVIGVPLAIAVW